MSRWRRQQKRRAQRSREATRARMHRYISETTRELLARPGLRVEMLGRRVSEFSMWRTVRKDNKVLRLRFGEE